MKTFILPEHFNHQTAPALSSSVLASLDQEPSTIRIQISDTCRIDSAGVATLLYWQACAQNRQNSLHLSLIPANLHNLLELYGLSDQFSTAP